MQKKYFKNSIISFILIVSTILMPLSFIPKKVEAQSIAGYTSGLGSAILTLPQCNIIGGTMGGIKKLFSGIGSLFSSSSGSEDPLAAANDEIKNAMSAKALGDIASSIATDFNAIAVTIKGTQAAEEISDIKANTKATRAATESLNENSTCIQSIGRLIIKMLLQKLTVSTIAWINSGFDGSPAFIQDPGKFFNDIAKNEILQFGLEIRDPALFPFGKIWMRNTALAFNNKFQDNARYSLDKLIKDTNPEYSAITFQQDFSQGGWNAWTAMTQSPANNPLGFQLMADNEIQRRLAGTTQSTAQYVHDALSQANGFLGDQRCVDPVGTTKQQDYDARVKGNTAGICKEWQYVTPGSLVASAATTAMGYQNNAYLNVQDLNDAVAAILDALLGQFSSNIMEKGFANFGDQGADGTLVFDTSGASDPFRSQTEKDFMPTQLTSSWLSANPNFNIRTDLTQALIDEQRTYSDKLKLQNKELLSTTDGNAYNLDEVSGESNSYGLIPTIYQLDYCIPGPHPGWEDDSRRALAAATNTILPETEESLADLEIEQVVGIAQTVLPLAGAAVGAVVMGGILAGTALGATIGTAAFPVVGTIVGAIVGTLLAFAISSFSSDDGINVRAYYGVIIQAFTGYLPDFGNKSDARALNLSSKAGAVGVLNTILDRYAVIINKIYYSDPEILPTVAKEAAVNYNQLTGYGAMMKNNEDKIASLKSTVNILGEIKDKVSNLNKTFPDGGDEYENQLKTQINAFGRLSASMVNGDDIAGADNLLKQIIDKKDYIYKNLLKGPYGCEADLVKTQTKFPADWSGYDVNSVKRMTYPFPILYDYTSTSTIGPGFLSFVYFTDENQDTRGSERLHLDDLLPSHYNYFNTALGLRATQDDNTLHAIGGPFETIIGVY